MSDFWDRNKGSITSGLKTAGKYGYQGTKYVAKTGYKAGKKNFNSRKKNEQSKKDKEKDEEDTEDEGDTRHRSYESHYRDPSTLPPPPVRGAPGQQYSPQYQQPQYQQPQYQQPQYQQPQPQYQQPPYQQPPYQQPQYQQPQYQQPPYQQPPYQQPPYQQSPYQQPPYQQPPYQQPQYQQPQYQQPQYQQPAYQSVPGQQPQPPSRSTETPSPAMQQSPVNQPPSQPSLKPFGNQVSQSAGNGVPMPGLAALPAQNEVVSPNPSEPNPNPQTSGVPMVAGPQGFAPPALEQQPMHSPVPSSGNVMPAYGRARLASPPLPGRDDQVGAVSVASTGAGSEGSIPGVTPYEYGSSEARRSASRLPMKSVDLASLPAPPTHRDRSTPDLTNGSLNSQSNHQDKQSSSAGNAESTPKPTLSRAPSEAESNEYNNLPTRTAAQSAVPMPPKRALNISGSVPQEDLSPATSAMDEPTEAVSNGIAGRFDYDVKVSYAPPPKPHRNVPDTSSRSSIPRKPAIPTQNIALNEPPSSSGPPVLPKRHSTNSTAISTETPAASERTFEPPPKPFRRTESSQLNQRADHASEPSVSVTHEGSGLRSTKDVSSFPPPPVRARPSTQSIVSSHDGNDGSPPPINPRGRLPASHLPAGGDQSISGSSESIASKKKAPPPVVKPKPKGLLSKNSTSTENIESKIHDHPQTSGISAITEELSHIKLRKSGSMFLEGEVSQQSKDHHFTPKKTPPPTVPRKRETLKHVPPVPMKSSSLRASTNDSDQTALVDKGNPFELYLKDAVPSEENRFHK